MSFGNTGTWHCRIGSDGASVGAGDAGDSVVLQWGCCASTGSHGHLGEGALNLALDHGFR
jgi:hypothetical protein